MKTKNSMFGVACTAAFVLIGRGVWAQQANSEPPLRGTITEAQAQALNAARAKNDAKIQAERLVVERAAKRTRRLKTPHVLNVRLGALGDRHRLRLSDFATSGQLRGLALLMAGKREEAAQVFEADLPTDTTGVSAVWLAQATPPAQWPAQIKTLDAQWHRHQSDTRLGFRVGLLMYYDAISTGFNLMNEEEFDEAYKQIMEMWQRGDPMSGMLLTELSDCSHEGWKNPDANALYASLIRVVGGKEAYLSFAQAKRAHFAAAPPPVTLVSHDRWRPLAGVLCGLWSTVNIIVSHAIVSPASPADTSKTVWANDPKSPDQDAQVAYLDRWIKSLYAAISKPMPVATNRRLPRRADTSAVRDRCALRLYTQ